MADYPQAPDATQQAVQPGAAAPNDGKIIDRNPPNVEQARAALVKDWIKQVEESKEFWKHDFDSMRASAKFAAGHQWEGEIIDEADPRYVANITLRHINQRVSSIYAKNPRVKATRKEKIWYQVWDGSPQMLHNAMLAVAAQQNPEGMAGAVAAGAAQPPTMDPTMAAAVMKEVEDAQQQKTLYDRLGKTLELVGQYMLDEPIPKFKIQAKQLVRRALTCKVGYVKLGYQRIMQYGPDLDARIKDATDRIAQIEMLTHDLADGEIQKDSKEAEELKLNLADFQKQKQIVLREGLVFGFPKAWSIIPDSDCTQLKGFVGAQFIAEEFIFTPKQVQKIYGKDVGSTYNPHTLTGTRGDKRKTGQKYCAVYEIYDLVGQMCFTVCSGYEDFLTEPGAPQVTTEQFHPYFGITFNDTENPDTIFPPSNVELMVSMAREYNRGREGLRTHRQANRPATVTSKGVFDDETKQKFSSHADHEIIETNLSKNDDINKAMVPKPTVPIKPELYDVEQAFVDTERVVGDQAANLGGTSDATATESSIAENSRVTTLQSNIDDLDEFLTDIMRVGGQILFLEMTEQMAKKIAGPGAVWPTQTRQQVAEELILEVKAGSSGRPNRVARLTAIEKTAPFLLQIPGINPRKLAEFMLTELDEGIDVDEFLDASMPSITAQNAQAKPNLAPGPGNDAQAAHGASNAEQPSQSPARAQNMYQQVSGAPPAAAAPSGPAAAPG